MTSRMCSVNPKLVNLPTIDLTISRSPWMKALPHPSVPSTPCLRKNLRLFVSSLRKTSLQVYSSFPLPMWSSGTFHLEKGWLPSTLRQFPGPQSHLEKRSLSASAHFRSCGHTEKSKGLYQNQPTAHLPSGTNFCRGQMEDRIQDPLWFL